jgi:phosphatidylinositol 3-kinase
MGLQRLDMTLPGKFNNSLNPGLEPRSDKLTWDEEDQVWKASKILDELKRLEQTPKKVLDAPPTSNFGHIQSVPWLDSITKEHCNEILAAVEESYQNVIFVDDDAPPILLLEMPFFDVPVLHEETFYPTPLDGACGGVTALELALARKQVEETHLSLVPFLDYESEQNNPVEDKYRTLAHDLLRGLVDPALKPDREQRDRLAAIIASPSHHPTREEKDLLWRFRFSLVDNRSALTKFLLAVDWEIESEVVQAAELLEQWRKRSPIEVTDALRLLGKHVAFQTNLVSSPTRYSNKLCVSSHAHLHGISPLCLYQVRSYAIDTLASAPDDELRLYLLQLVQAIKYEDTEQTVASSLPLSGQSSTKSSRSGSSLAHFLIERAAKNIELANFLYW